MMRAASLAVVVDSRSLVLGWSRSITFWSKAMHSWLHALLKLGERTGGVLYTSGKPILLTTLPCPIETGMGTAARPKPQLSPQLKARIVKLCEPLGA